MPLRTRTSSARRILSLPVPDPPSTPPAHFVYIVRCADGSLYTGYALDPEARIDAHNAGRGARYTSGRRPVTLVHIETFAALGEALKREHALKRLPRAAKQALIRHRNTGEMCDV